MIYKLLPNIYTVDYIENKFIPNYKNKGGQLEYMSESYIKLTDNKQIKTLNTFILIKINIDENINIYEKNWYIVLKEN